LLRPEELDVLRTVYEKQFFHLSVFTPEEDRRATLVREWSVPEHQVDAFMQRDMGTRLDTDIIRDLFEDPNWEPAKKEHSIAVKDTFERADLFVPSTPQRARREIERFVEMIFGEPFHTPTTDEFGMAMAYTARLRSADLARQVGAAVLSPDGDTIALGYNAAPKAGGGQYTEDDLFNGADHAYLGVDSSDLIRAELRDEVWRHFQRPLAKSGLSEKALAELKKGLRNLRFNEVVEYGRSVHAEMAALSTAARLGRAVSGATLYCTTFPCHECTRHIVASGIARVVYIEPYPKSRAERLFADSIALGEKSRHVAGRVPFEPFTGVSPHRFYGLFRPIPSTRKDTNGFAITSQRVLRPTILEPLLRGKGITAGLDDAVVSRMNIVRDALVDWFVEQTGK
jgi:cytidine deaminase